MVASRSPVPTVSTEAAGIAFSIATSTNPTEAQAQARTEQVHYISGVGNNLLIAAIGHQRAHQAAHAHNAHINGAHRLHRYHGSFAALST